MRPPLAHHTELLCGPSGVTRAAELLRQGALVAIPTETVYGLAADATEPDAIAAIYAAKGRPAHNPLIVHVPDISAGRRLAMWSDEASQLAEAFWPGALTLVLSLAPSSGLAAAVTAGGESVALRAPDHPLAQAVLRQTERPLAAPSANPSGRISPSRAAHVLDPEMGLGGRIAAVLDGGACDVGVESTIIGWRAGRATLLRAGGVSAEAIEAVLGHPLEALGEGAMAAARPDSPGQLRSHYAPRQPLRMNAAPDDQAATHICFGPAGPGQLTLSATGDPEEAARNLFAILRRADALGRPISVAPIPMAGLGRAINDRLRRAAAPRDA